LKGHFLAKHQHFDAPDKPNFVSNFASNLTSFNAKQLVALPFLEQQQVHENE
jgi:hypothetical protein